MIKETNNFKNKNPEIIARLGKLKKLSKNPLVSLVIAAKDEQKYIGVTLKSLLNQSYNPIEIIVVDDNSSDKTPTIVKNFSDKRIKLIRLPKSEGYGTAYNIGAENSKGAILMFFDAHLIYGKDFVKDLTLPIIQGKEVATRHKAEKIANKSNLWARAEGSRIISEIKRHPVPVFIRKDVFEKIGPFDNSLGYSSDRTLFLKSGLTSAVLHTEIAHFNRDTMESIWNQGKWIGRSNKNPIKTIFSLPLSPFYVLYKSFKQFLEDPYWKFIYFLPIYHSVRYFSYFIGAIERLKGKKLIR